MDPLGITALVAFVGAAVAAAYARDRKSGDKRFARSLEEAESKEVAALAERDVARVEGKVELIEEHTSPASGRVCAAYSLIVQVPINVGWHIIATDASAADFLIVDDTGKARVDVTHARVALKSGTPVELTQTSARVHAEYLAMKAGVQLPEGARIVESILAPDDRAIVVGYVSREPDPTRRDGGTYRQRATRAVLSGKKNAPLRLKRV